ncbi:MAG: hypothetical protein J0L83_14750 [Chitinophagales bacterium]|nr:hypothetical protein [Chitinophagales bacterium]
MNTIITILVISILVFSLPMWLQLLSIRKAAKKNHELSDKQYWELKYKYQSLISLFAVIVAAFFFIAGDSLEKVRLAVIDQLRPKIDSLQDKIVSDSLKFARLKDDLEASSSDFKNSIDSYNNKAESIGKKSSYTSEQLAYVTSSLKEAQSKIEKINQYTILRKDIYIVNDSTTGFRYKKNVIPAIQEIPALKLYFKDLVTINGDRLPEFKEAPTVMVFSKNQNVFSVEKVTKEYVIVLLIQGWGSAEENAYPIMYISGI